MLHCSEQTESIWQVVGGAANGGIIARTGRATSSKQAPNRLATGSLVRALEIDLAASRMHFEKLQGAGPLSGWISTHFQGKALLCEATGDSLQHGKEPERDPASLELTRAPGTLVQRELERDLGIPEVETDNQSPWKSMPRLLGQDLRVKKQQIARATYDIAQDSDGEELHLCAQCNLPLGELAYCRDSKYVHGACAAQLMSQAVRKEDEIRQEAERIFKNKRRAEYDIGWTEAHIPSNRRLAQKLIGCDVPDGMLCLTLHPGTKSVGVGVTTDPEASVNMEYLSVALDIRRREGHEPIFSLDPANAQDKNTMQEKVFVPERLAGTSVGEVLFQADYHLKELSMGEHEQPVLGMRSCFEYNEMAGHDAPWNAREWFMVRKAEVKLSDNDELIPCVKLGVEAREQIIGNNGLEDAPITRPDHPMVKYAEAFTHNFDLIAERKSVIHHLRELAKAVVMAKFLLDLGAPLEEDWFHLADGSEATCSFGWEVPQLWNQHLQSNIHVRDGALVNGNRRKWASTHGVYGGVDLGLKQIGDLAASINARLGQRAAYMGRESIPPVPKDVGMMSSDGLEGVEEVSFLDFDLSAKTPAPRLARQPLVGKPIPSRFQAGAALQSVGVGPRPEQSTQDGLTTSVRKQLTRGLVVLPPSLSVDGRGLQGIAALQGVDLRLDQFDLSTMSRVDYDSQREHAEKVCKDQSFLSDIFQAGLSDRRIEGERIVPPRPSCSYIGRLTNLVDEERSVRDQRSAMFFSREFGTSHASSLFPSSWASSFNMLEQRPQVALSPCPGYAAEPMLAQRLKITDPIFDNRTEEGLRFRIYRLGSLEVRTTQGASEDEHIGAVFSISAAVQTSAGNHQTCDCISMREKIVKVTEYVERCTPGDALLGQNTRRLCSDSGACRQYYIVLETELGNKVVTEQLDDGLLTWEENPVQLEDRSLLAKATRCSASSSGVTVEDFKSFHASMGNGIGRGNVASPSRRKSYARAAYGMACGRVCTPVRMDPVPTIWASPSVSKHSQDASSIPEVRRKPSELQLMAHCFRG